MLGIRDRVVKTTKTTHPGPGPAVPADLDAGTAVADTPVAPGTEGGAAPGPVPSRADRVNALAETLRTAARARQAKLAPEARTPDAVLWKRCRREAKQKIRIEDRQAWRRKKAQEVRADLRSLHTRNSAQLTPWLLAAPYAGTGAAANLLAHHGAHAANPMGIAAVAGGVSAIVSYAAWRKKIGAKVPARYQERVRNWMGIGCAWTAAMPLQGTGSGQAGMWLLAVGGTALAAMPWWREHRHPYPLLDEDDCDLAHDSDDGADRDSPSERLELARQIEADWDDYVAPFTLTGSVLRYRDTVNHGLVFDLHLVRGKQKIDNVRRAKADIVAALDLDAAQFGIAKGRNEYTLDITVITEEIENPYTGPRIIREGGDVFIEIGPYEDGIGAERFHVLADQLSPAQLAAGEKPRGSMNGGMIVGSKGSGKSRLMEEISDGLDELGVKIWYCDPQEGQSSPALMAEADWPISGLNGVDRETGGLRVYGNLIDLWLAVRSAVQLRSTEGAVAGEPGFQHTRERPAIMVVIDECHRAFQAINPLTGNTFGEDFADLDRMMRKNGIAILGGSQSITADTFGRGNKATVLRDGMCSVNVYILAYTAKNVGLVPGYAGQPVDTLPLNRGYGYNPKGARPHTRFQARYTSDFGSFMAQRPKHPLDERLQKRLGPTYTKRFEKAEDDRAVKKALLDAIDAADGDASFLPRFDRAAQPAGAPTAGTGAGGSGGSPHGGHAPDPSRMSPAMRRKMAKEAAARAASEAEEAVPEADEGESETGVGSEATETETETSPEGLTVEEQRAYDSLADEPKNLTDLGKALGVSRQAATKKVARLVAKNQATQLPDGRYTVE
ncbi:hypothetical protein [Amycolatopsis sp. NPDC004079]|uniref:hypothetical protein n=1 Tax=Amycolatopsis sp. NPDC004079 TaxID=3154549 RepID=UPI0033AC081C